MTSLLGGVCLVQDASIIGGFPESVERNLHFAISAQSFVGYAYSFLVDGTSLSWPSPINKRLRRVCSAGNVKLNAAVKADRERGSRRHIHFLTATGDRNNLTSDAFPQGLKATGSDFITYGCRARLGCELPSHPTKVDTASGPSPNHAMRKERGI